MITDVSVWLSILNEGASISERTRSRLVCSIHRNNCPEGGKDRKSIRQKTSTSAWCQNEHSVGITAIRWPFDWQGTKCGGSPLTLNAHKKLFLGTRAFRGMLFLKTHTSVVNSVTMLSLYKCESKDFPQLITALICTICCLFFGCQ